MVKRALGRYFRFDSLDNRSIAEVGSRDTDDCSVEGNVGITAEVEIVNNVVSLSKPRWAPKESRL